MKYTSRYCISLTISYRWTEANQNRRLQETHNTPKMKNSITKVPKFLWSKRLLYVSLSNRSKKLFLCGFNIYVSVSTSSSSQDFSRIFSDFYCDKTITSIQSDVNTVQSALSPLRDFGCFHMSYMISCPLYRLLKLRKSGWIGGHNLA